MAKNKSEFSVHLTDPNGEAICIAPGADIPAWAAKLITNPLVLGGESSDPDEDESDDDGTGRPPPKSGKGGGVRAWRAYAAANGVDGDGLDVDEIVASLEAVGVPTE